MASLEKKINIGCGPTGQIHGFDNIDNSPTILGEKIPFLKNILYRIGILSEHQFRSNWSKVIRCDASKGLPYKNESVSKIYSSHFLEHIPFKKGPLFLSECYRVLKVNGVMRIVVPDLLFHAKKYVDSTTMLLNDSAIPDNRSIHDNFFNTLCGAYLSKKRYGAAHYYMYDLPTLVCLLKNVGFNLIKNFDYKKGDDDELKNYDSRPEDSLHVEAWKITDHVY